MTLQGADPDTASMNAGYLKNAAFQIQILTVT